MKINISLQLILFSVTLVVLSVGVSMWQAYDNSRNQLEESLGKELLSLVNSLSPFISADRHDSIVRVDESFVDGWDDFKRIRAQLVAVKKSNQLNISAHGSPLYTMRKSYDFDETGMLEFVVMTDPNTDGEYFVGYQFPAEPHHLKVFREGQSYATGLYTDNEGVWISAAAPIKNRRGEVVGLVQADRYVDFFYAKVAEVAKQLFLGALASVFIASLLALYYSKRFTQPIKRVVTAARAFGQGDYDQLVELKGSRSDEIGYLAETFNNMSTHIKASHEKEVKQRNTLAKLSKALAQANKGLEQRVAARTKQLASSHQKLKKTLASLEQSQATLVQSEKMASVGQLAAGVAHEINNPMAFITSNMGTLRDYVGSIMGVLDKVTPVIDAVQTDDKQVLEQAIAAYHEAYEAEDIGFVVEDTATLLDDSIDGAERVKSIVSNLKDFSRVDNEGLQLADINACIESSLKIATNETKYSCEIVTNLGDIPEIVCNAGKLNQVFLNLLVNAAQAMEGQGVITITTESTDTHVIATFADTGKGIPKENLDKLFDAFYTTKPVGEGTGLGLYISYGIIQEHDGEFKVESEVGKGTTFTIELPIVTE